MLKILWARLQQYVNRELADVQAGFRKGRGTRDQIAKCQSLWRCGSQQTGKFLKRWEYQTTFPDGKDWCWSWNSNTLATWCEELTHLKRPDAEKDWRQEEKGTTEDEMVGWHHWHNGHGFGWTPGVGDGQGGLACCGSWGYRVIHDWGTELKCPFLHILSGTYCLNAILFIFLVYVVRECSNLILLCVVSNFLSITCWRDCLFSIVFFFTSFVID